MKDYMRRTVYIRGMRNMYCPFADYTKYSHEIHVQQHFHPKIEFHIEISLCKLCLGKVEIKYLK